MNLIENNKEGNQYLFFIKNEEGKLYSNTDIDFVLGAADLYPLEKGVYVLEVDENEKEIYPAFYEEEEFSVGKALTALTDNLNDINEVNENDDTTYEFLINESLLLIEV